MTADPNVSEGRRGRPLVLRAIPPERGTEEVSPRDPEAGLVAPDLVWELCDPWASHGRATAALAVTRRVGDMVILLDVTVVDSAAPETIGELVQQLVASLRREDAAVVCSSMDDRAVREELLAAGFVPLPNNPDDETAMTPVGPTRLILQM